MSDGQYDLDRWTSEHKFLYLCAVRQPDTKRDGLELNRRMTNVHLAVYPSKGSVASVGSVYGVTFTITDAQAISIMPLSADSIHGLPKAHYRCKNFQCGYQMFEATASNTALPGEVVYKARVSN